MGGTFLEHQIYEGTKRCPLCNTEDELLEQIWNFKGKSEQIKYCGNCKTSFKLMGGKKNV